MAVLNRYVYRVRWSELGAWLRGNGWAIKHNVALLCNIRRLYTSPLSPPSVV